MSACVYLCVCIYEYRVETRLPTYTHTHAGWFFLVHLPTNFIVVPCSYCLLLSVWNVLFFFIDGPVLPLQTHCIKIAIAPSPSFIFVLWFCLLIIPPLFFYCLCVYVCSSFKP